MRALFCHIVDHLNIGDRVCCPMPYFDWNPWEAFEVDLRSEMFTFESAAAIILGGGGLLCEGYFVQVSKILNHGKRRNVPVIGWGFGHNLIGETKQNHPEFLKHFDLIAIRDRCGLRYCPCPSCLHPAFTDRMSVEPFREEVYYMHYQNGVEPPKGVHYMTNARAPFEFPSVLDFLASGKTIVTSTFHGAYWGLLLGRRVRVPNAWSSRFMSLPNGRGQGGFEAGPLPDYYHECVDLNLAFAYDVKKLIGLA